MSRGTPPGASWGRAGPGNAERVEPAGRSGGKGTLADRPECHPPDHFAAGRSRQRRGSTGNRSCDGRPPFPRWRPGVPKDAGGLPRWRPVPKDDGRLPKLGSRSEDQTRLAMTAALKRRPRKNRDVALSDTTPHADDSMHPKDTPHRRGPTSTSEGGFGLRSQHPACPVRTPGRVREPGKRCVRFDASALPLTRIIRFSFGGNSDLQVKVRFLCINFRDAHNTSTRYPQSRAHCRTAKPNRRGFLPSGMDPCPRPNRDVRSRDTSGHYD